MAYLAPSFINNSNTFN